MTNTVQNNYERIFYLIEILKNHPEPLTKQEIFQKLSKFYNQEKEKAKEKLFERDKKLLNELGFQLKQFRFFKSQKGKKESFVIGYKISDFSLNKNYLNKFSEHDKEKMAILLLNRLKQTKNKKDYNKLYLLYIKLFLNDPVYLKKILNFKLNLSKNEFETLQNHPKHLQNTYKHFIELLKNKPLQIVYKKKTNEMIERIIFPLLIYKKYSLYYLISWDYEHSALRNFIIQNIQKVQQVNDSRYPIVTINDDITNRMIHSKVIEIPLKEIYFNLPNPLFIKNEEDSELKTIIITIKEDYLSIFKDYLNVKQSFFRKNLNFHIVGKATNEVTISFKLYNLEGLFRFLFLYPEALIRFEDKNILNQYKNYINNIIKFYQK